MGYPVRNKNNESKGIGSGEVTKYHLSPEELAKYGVHNPPKNRDGEVIKKPVNIPTKAEKKPTKGRQPKHPHITKEFLEAEFAAGKTASQIEREQGMSPNSIFAYLKRFGVVNPNNKKVVPPKLADGGVVSTPNKLVGEDSEELFIPLNQMENIDKAVQRLSDAFNPHKYITIQLPIIETGDDRIQQRLKVIEELEEVGTEIEASNIDRTRTMSELLDLVQACIGLIRTDLVDLCIDEPDAQLQKFFDHHGKLHIEKINRYASERGWRVVG